VKKITKEAKKVDRTGDALRRLHVSLDQLAAAPQITPMLKRAEGGLDTVLTAMRFAPDGVINAYLQKYDTIPVGDREHLSMEAIALAAGLDTNSLLGSVMIALQAQAVNTVKIIAMTAHPKITEARVLFGQMPLGVADRNALDTAMGFLPSPKGPTFINKAIFGSGKSVMDQQRGDDDDPVADVNDPDLDRLFPQPRTMQEKLTPIRQRLPPPSS